MKKNVFCFAACLGLLLLTSAAFAQQGPDTGFESQGYIQKMDKGEINWQSGLARATGIGAPPENATNMAQARAMALRAATVVARRNLLEVVKGVHIDSTTTVENYMVRNDLIVSKVRGFLQNSQILNTRYMSDGSVEVEVGIGLRGGFANVLIPEETQFSEQAPKPNTTEPEPIQVKPDMQDQGQEDSQLGIEAKDTAYTGLVVDASSLDARPAMSPKILDEDGAEVYGSAMVSREYAIQQGMAGYAKDMDKARSNPRVANNPYQVEAVGTEGKANTNVVLSNEQANRLRSMADNVNFLEKCRVMIVLD
ncbi:MAG: LPP20 family lipoprotein [Desulfonatronovibrionaceae bacterium]